MPDPFKLTTDDYSVDDFYIASKDKARESEVIRVRVPAQAARQMSEIIQQRRVPMYRTREDFYRDAVIHRLHYLSESEIFTSPTLELMLADAIAQSHAETLRWMTEMHQDTIDNLTLASSREVNDPVVARAMRVQVNPLIDSTSPSVREAAMKLLNKLDRPIL